MRKLTVLLLLLVAGTLSYAQTNQQLLEAYRNGTLSASQIEDAIIKMCEAQYRKKLQQKER